eukprot:TRINITY_DN15368_c0_g1_i4.p1 TRINITY_DN15368_c0_g1~~TRINITY_DN15368_c0_g1_i4.p1  ORF type:complete len:295 (+),score=13.31 TRINITY_DN15368_c0_g1_i4:25-885(+)
MSVVCMAVIGSAAAVKTWWFCCGDREMRHYERSTDRFSMQRQTTTSIAEIVAAAGAVGRCLTLPELHQLLLLVLRYRVLGPILAEVLTLRLHRFGDVSSDFITPTTTTQNACLLLRAFGGDDKRLQRLVHHRPLPVASLSACLALARSVAIARGAVQKHWIGNGLPGCVAVGTIRMPAETARGFSKVSLAARQTAPRNPEDAFCPQIFATLRSAPPGLPNRRVGIALTVSRGAFYLAADVREVDSGSEGESVDEAACTDLLSIDIAATCPGFVLRVKDAVLSPTST